MTLCKTVFFNMKIATCDFRNYVHYERGLCRMTHTQMIAYIHFLSQHCNHLSLCNQDVVGLIPSCYMPVMPVMLVANTYVHPDLINKGKQHMVCNITAVKIKKLKIYSIFFSYHSYGRLG